MFWRHFWIKSLRQSECWATFSYSKKEMKPEFQLLFDLVNKVFLLRVEGRSGGAILDLYLMEALNSCTPFSLLKIMIKHITKFCKLKEINHGMAYGFLLT